MSEYLLIFSLLLGVCLILQYFVKHVWKLKYLPDSGATLLLGIVIGGAIRFSMNAEGKAAPMAGLFNPALLGFSPTVFYFGFLPPIIFSSGYHLKRRLFFRNIRSILLLALVGTCISTALVSVGLYFMASSEIFNPGPNAFKLSVMECVTFGSLLASTDPVATLAIYSSLRVDPTLFYLVFGESVLNDAIAIVIFKVSSKFIGSHFLTAMDALYGGLSFIVSFVSSLTIGYILGIAAAWCFKFVPFRETEANPIDVTDMLHPSRTAFNQSIKNAIMRKDAVKSVSAAIVPVGLLLCTVVYVPFFLSEMLQFSGIVTVLFTGISARRYVNKNITDNVKIMASFVFQLLSSLAETSCFALLGVSIFLDDLSMFHFRFIGGTVALLLLARAAHVYPLLSLANMFDEHHWLWKWRTTSSTSDTESNLEVTNTTKLPDRTITSGMKHMIFFAGLRGAVSYSLANLFPDDFGNRQLVRNTTAVVIIFTTFFMGCLTESAIELCQIRKNIDPAECVHDIPDGEELQSNSSVCGYLKSILLSFETRYIYPCVLSRSIGSTSLSMTAFSAGDNAPHGRSKYTIVEEQQQMEMELGSQVSSGGGSAVASPNFRMKRTTTASGRFIRSYSNSNSPYLRLSLQEGMNVIQLNVVDETPCPEFAPHITVETYSPISNGIKTPLSSHTNSGHSFRSYNNTTSIQHERQDSVGKNNSSTNVTPLRGDRDFSTKIYDHFSPVVAFVHPALTVDNISLMNKENGTLSGETCLK
eukprot:CAMPEP_0170073510 /NCGR_PEP_ID=MMETSP0019_2-20121128/10914_1 /TAXON_ID=98059 /ORGANISM="Dinobryon sp., Strain UTEXLB2267" /LENGTH=755 /DNA_ID=CAMNT_0010283085 /DNA_START=68 /DNA_END=2335 /DNA_ORIENTATION=+